MQYDLSIIDVPHWIYTPEPGVDCANWMFAGSTGPQASAPSAVVENTDGLILA